MWSPQTTSLVVDVSHQRCSCPPPDTPSLMPDRIVRLLGQGTFGKVVEATHLSSQRKVAVKIIRAIPKYREASNIEIRVLKLLKERDPANRQCVLARPPRPPSPMPAL